MVLKDSRVLFMGRRVASDGGVALESLSLLKAPG